MMKLVILWLFKSLLKRLVLILALYVDAASKKNNSWCEKDIGNKYLNNNFMLLMLLYIFRNKLEKEGINFT